MRRGLKLSIITVALIIMVITIYFYYQHIVVVNEYRTNNKVLFEGATINIDKLTIKNSEKKQHIGTNFLISLAMKSNTHHDFILNIGRFYLKPYNRLNYNILSIFATVENFDKSVEMVFCQENGQLKLNKFLN